MNMESHKLLSYSELIAPNRFDRILMPSEIPCHHLVYTSQFAYTPEFAEEVRRRVPASIDQDVLEIERIFGKKFRIVIQNGKIFDENADWRKISLDGINVIAEPERRSIDVLYCGSNIALEDRRLEQRRILRLDTNHPLSLDRLREYASNPKEEELIIPRWHVHNIYDNGFILELYFRNFAIMFNNAGIERLNSQ